MNNKVEQFRNGMFLASSRRCGETYMEPILRKFYGWIKSLTKDNDAINAVGKYIEIKCSKVLIELLKDPSLTESVILENDNFILKRLIKFADCWLGSLPIYSGAYRLVTIMASRGIKSPPSSHDNIQNIDRNNRSFSFIRD